MKIFLFDLLPYGENLDYLKTDGRLPRPLTKKYFKPDVQIRTYADHLDAWEAAERAGFDGIAFNEHHGTPYGTMNSPNLMAAAVSQRTKRMKILIYANLLPIHDPLRLAEEIAMLDCMTEGRLIAGVARGIPREYPFFNVPMGESRERFDECFEIMRRAWTQESFSYEGKFHSYKDVSIWPRPVQAPHPPVWLPISGSRESIEWAAANDISITPSSFLSLEAGLVQERIVAYYAECMKKHGHSVTPEKISMQFNCYIADSKAQAVEEVGPYMCYLHNTLVPFDQAAFDKVRESGYSTQQGQMRPAINWQDPSVRERKTGPLFGGVTMDVLRARADEFPWGTADDICASILREVEKVGAGTVILMCNPGDLPREMYLKQIERLGREVLPRLQAHKVTRVPLASNH